MSNSPIQKFNQPGREFSAGDDLAPEESESGGGAIDRDSFNSRKVFGNILSLGISEIVSRAIAFVGMSFIARRLGPDGFGIVGFAATILLYLSLPTSFGFNDVGTREVARRPRQATLIAFNAILVKLVVALIIFGALGLAMSFSDDRRPIKSVVLLMSLTLFSLAIDTSWVYRGLERNQRVGMALVLGQALYVVTLLLVVRDPGDVFYVPLAQLAGETGAALLLLVPLYRLGKIELKLREGLRILRDSGFWTISRLFRVLIYTFDLVLIGFILGERAVGLYTAPYRICLLLAAIAAAVHASYLPAITRAFAESVEQARLVAERSIHLAAAVAAPMMVGGMVLAAPLLQAVFGSEYIEGAGAFRLLLLGVGFLFLHGANHNLLLASDRTKSEMTIFAAAAAVNVTLNVIFIPRYGLLAAAFITALAEGLTLLLGLIVLSNHGVRLKIFRALLRPLAASILMGAVLFALGSGQMIVLYLGVGGACYVFFLVLLRGVPREIQPYLQNIAAFAEGLRIKLR